MGTRRMGTGYGRPNALLRQGQQMTERRAFLEMRIMTNALIRWPLNLAPGYLSFAIEAATGEQDSTLADLTEEQLLEVYDSMYTEVNYRDA